NVPQTSLYSSTVQAKVVNNIAPQGTGRIQKLNVEVGDFVAKGQVLAEMDKVQLEQAQLKLRNDETELERVRTLLSQGGISQADFDQLELAFNVSKSSCRNIEENTILRSPVSGVITARNYDRGDMFTMGQPIYTVQQITPVKILVGISETDYTRVKKGDTVSITADALPGKEFSGTVNRLYPTMDPATHTFNVEVTVPNTRRELRPGMYARVTVNFGSTFNIVLPDTAVLKMQGAGTRSVFVVDPEGKAEMRVVTLGRHFDGKYEILSGLEEGEQVVVKGNSALKAGQAVQIG
ncbi:MAG: efflux RND transporter periplasmic adaptor subunit, partial [Bacteroidales bacterium]|nr:efflux RND transporter periplasmic adaptor subunit [Bacteroidales bacterium]